MTLADLKALFRRNVKVIPGGPTSKSGGTRGAGMLEMLDALADSIAEPGQVNAPTTDQVLALLRQGTGIEITRTSDDKILITNKVAQPTASPRPLAPTAGQVDDTADTFGFLANPAYPSFAQYKVGGLPGVTGAVYLDATNSYVQGPRIYIKVVGTVAKGG